MSHTQKAIAGVIGVILLLVIFRVLFYGRVSRQLEQLKKESASLEQQLSAAAMKAAGLKEVEREIAAARRTLDQLELQYPRSIEAVYQTITDAARETGLKISRRETSENPSEEGVLRRYEISIQASCSYRQLGEFLDRISSSPILVLVSSLTVTADAPDLPKSPAAVGLRVDMRLTTYLGKTNGA